MVATVTRNSSRYSSLTCVETRQSSTIEKKDTLSVELKSFFGIHVIIGKIGALLSSCSFSLLRCQ